MSDLHFEFFPGLGADFIHRMKPDGVDALVIAGDLCTLPSLRKNLTDLCAKYRYVLFTPGNHEYYNSSFWEIDGVLAEAAAKLRNLRILENAAVEIDGVHIVGSCLWFPDQPDNARWAGMLNDFQLIDGFVPEVYDRNRRTIEYFRKVVREGDVVVTHHLPSNRSVAAQFKGNALNRFFVSPVDDLILERRPSLWIHGHTHLSMDYRIGGTRILCNPHGYYGEENREFRSRLNVSL